MATATVKQNGVSKKSATTTKKEVQQKLAKQAVGEKTEPIKPPVVPIAPVVDLQSKLERFEKMKGLAGQRERLTNTLTELNKFKYNQSDSASFKIVDSQNLSFSTTNTNLIHLVTNHLKATLETRKAEIEAQLIAFEI